MDPGFYVLDFDGTLVNRRGEVLAVRWIDLDFDSGRLRITEVCSAPTA
jgi:hypothetical protein